MTTVKSGGTQIDWGLRGNDRIAQNVRNLINTFRYEIPYHRIMGLPGGIIDRPVNMLTGEIRVEIAQMLSIYEPRADVLDIHVSADSCGNLVVEVVLK